MKQYNSFHFDKDKTEDYKLFLSDNGFLHFKGFFDQNRMIEISTQYNNTFHLASQKSKQELLSQSIIKGKRNNAEIQRIPFLTKQTPFFQDIITREIYDRIKTISFQHHRIGFNENNGVVATKYNNTIGGWSQMGWHTDIGNSFYYLTNRNHYYNIGLHLDKTDSKTGCLKILPGSHKQSIFSLYTKKVAFLDRRHDPKELNIETEPGDLTIHDGRLWHRVSKVSKTRRVIYFNLLKGKKVSEKTTNKTSTHLKVFIYLKDLLNL